MTVAPPQRGKLERLCRYVSRPPVACERLALTASGQVRYALKTPYRDGITHLVLEPLEPPTDPVRPPTPRQVALSWARRLKRVFGIEIEGCVRCGGQLKIIASIEEHLERTAPQQYPTELPPGARAGDSQCSWRSGGLAWSPGLPGMGWRR